MTTAKTRRPTTTAGPQRGASAKKSGKARQPIPVLIRLPELRIEPETKADHEVLTADEASRAAISLLATPADSLLPPASHAEVSRPDAAAIAGGEPGSAAVPSPGWHRPSWSEFRLPRGAVHGGIAVGLIAVLVVAYFAIAGRSTRSETTVTEDRMPSPADQPPSTVPPVGLPAPPGPVAASAAPDRTGKEPDAAEKAELAEKPIKAEAAGSSLSQPAQQAADAVGSPPPPAVEAQTPSAPQAVIPQGPALTTAAADAPRAEIPAEAPAPADADSRSPLTLGAPVGDGGVAGDVPRYPVTNPATFQYPPEYHLRLQAQARGGASRDTGAAAGGMGQDDGQPSTARLQPRIEPPPVR